jgi:glycosyltransferase involved in cell wall biosynthesis
MNVSIVIATVAGREKELEQNVAALHASAGKNELEIIVIRDHSSIGQAANTGVAAASGDYIALIADDMIPHPGWFEAAKLAADLGYYPAPRIDNPDGSVLATGSMGGGWILTDCADWAPVCSSQLPFMNREVWADIGPSLEIGYYMDDYLSARARAAGLIVAYREGYRFTHIEGTAGHAELASRWMIDRLQFEQAMSQQAWATVAA